MYFPLFVDITESEFLVVGSGKVAGRKLATLQKFTGRITVVTEDTDYVNDSVRVVHKSYSADDLQGMHYVLAATDSEEINLRIASDCREKGILCDVSVHPEQGDFIFPGVVKRGDITVAVTTDGRSPAVARYVRETIDEMLPEYLDRVLDIAEEYRYKVAEVTEDRVVRRALNRKIVELLVSTGGEAAEQDIDRIISEI